MSKTRHKYIAARPMPVTPTRKLGPRRWAYHQPVHARSTLGMVLKRSAVALLLLLVIGGFAILGYKLWVNSQTEKLIYTVDSPALPQQHVAMVFGAGLDSEGEPSPMLYDRVATAADLYDKGKVQKLLMTGDNSTVDHNEVEAMRKTAVGLGVDDSDIVLDYAGFSTWDSCYRAREVFNLSEATLVTQQFHLPRAIYTCNQLGVKSVGVIADRQPYHTVSNEVREYIALANTAFRFLTNDQPRFLGPKIDIDQPQSR